MTKTITFILTLFFICPTYEIYNEPTEYFIEQVKSMNSKNWIHDTERLSSVTTYGELKPENIRQFSNLPFLSLQYSNSLVSKRNISRKFDNIRDKENLSKVKSIWSYFYRKEPQEKTNPDGVIEQWEFESKEQAKLALSEIQKIGMFVYVNIRPYYLQRQNYLYVFHTRAMAFSFEQKAIYNQFKNSIKE